MSKRPLVNQPTKKVGPVNVGIPTNKVASRTILDAVAVVVLFLVPALGDDVAAAVAVLVVALVGAITSYLIKNRQA